MTAIFTQTGGVFEKIRMVPLSREFNFISGPYDV